MNMIKVQGLHKNIKGKAILKDIFEVADGEGSIGATEQERPHSWTVCLR